MKTLSPPARVWSPGAPLLGAARRAAGHAGLSRADRAAPAPPVAGLRGRWDAVAATATAGQPRRIGTEHKARTSRPCARRRVRRSVPGLQAEAAAQMPAETLPAARPLARSLARLPPLAPPAVRSARPGPQLRPAPGSARRARARLVLGSSREAAAQRNRATFVAVCRSLGFDSLLPSPSSRAPSCPGIRGPQRAGQSSLDRGPTAMDELLVLLSATSYSGGTPEKRVTSEHEGWVTPLHTHTWTGSPCCLTSVSSCTAMCKSRPLATQQQSRV